MDANASPLRSALYDEVCMDVPWRNAATRSTTCNLQSVYGVAAHRKPIVLLTESGAVAWRT